MIPNNMMQPGLLSCYQVQDNEDKINEGSHHRSREVTFPVPRNTSHRSRAVTFPVPGEETTKENQDEQQKRELLSPFTRGHVPGAGSNHSPFTRERVPGS